MAVDDWIKAIIGVAASIFSRKEKGIKELEETFETYSSLEQKIMQDKRRWKDDQDRLDLDDRLLTEARAFLARQAPEPFTLYEENSAGWNAIFFLTMSLAFFASAGIAALLLGSLWWVLYVVVGVLFLTVALYLMKRLARVIGSSMVLSRGRKPRKRLVERGSDPISAPILTAIDFYEEKVNRLLATVLLWIVVAALLLAIVCYRVDFDNCRDAVATLLLVPTLVSCLCVIYRAPNKIISKIVVDELRYCEQVPASDADTPEDSPALSLQDIVCNAPSLGKAAQFKLPKGTRAGKKTYRVEGKVTIDGTVYGCLILRFADKTGKDAEINDKVIINVRETEINVNKLREYEKECGFAIGLYPLAL